MQHRPTTRSQTQRPTRSAAIKRDAASNVIPFEPKRKRKLRRRVNKSMTVSRIRPPGGVAFLAVEDGTVTVDQNLLEDSRQEGLKDGYLRDYDAKRKGVSTRRLGYALLIWGDGSMGQLGVEADPGTDDDSDCPDLQTMLPEELSLTMTVLDASAGGMHTLMLMEDGSLQSFGSNDEGALGRKTVGDVWDVEEDSDSEMKQSTPSAVHIPDLVSSIKNVECTDSGSFVCMDDGRIFGWGSFRSSSGMVGFSEDVMIQKLPICVYQPPSKGKCATKLATGGHHVLALLEDGSVLSWGDGEKGQLGRCHPENDSRSVMFKPTAIPSLEKEEIVDIYCGEAASFFKTSSSTILACGLNSAGQLGIAPLPEFADDACPTVESSVQGNALFLEPVEVKSLSDLQLDVKDISSGKRHTLVLTTEGDVYSFGAPMYGVLGRFEEDSEAFSKNLPCPPEKISGLEGHRIEKIAAGQDCSACIDNEGQLFRFGGEHSGLICVKSDGDDILTPRLLKKGNAAKTFEFSSVEFGGQHGIILGKKKEDDLEEKAA